MKKLIIAVVLLAGIAAVAFASYNSRNGKAKTEKKTEKKTKKTCRHTCSFSS